ncbi:hypothetical protein [Streptomyces sp. NPDC007856]|uniref:hypothetical protein n=1 Tax=Streptomyces sp. NPDC007856 TaxID=3364781 RepID=UPI0036B9AD0D
MVSAAACGAGGALPARTGASALAVSTRSSQGSPAPVGSSASGSTRQCLSGTVTVRYPPADNPLRTACVHVGTTIHIILKPPPRYGWAPVTSSDPRTVPLLDDHAAPDGTRSATACAAAAGTASLNSADTYTPDPHGPSSRVWRLTLTVIP